jgi:serine phosphatase RsbU (regulator of sigma subunit)
MQGLPLGVLPDTVYPHIAARMGSPAILLMYTDGLIDARNSEGEPYGKRRLKSWLFANSDPGTRAPEQRDRLVAELNRFRGDTVMDDDQAFLLLTEDRVAVPRAATPGAKRSRQSASPLLSPANS